jgi:RNA polymerase II subunit A-like phosphatase
MTDNDIKYRIPAGCLPATIIDIKTSKSKAHSEGDSLIEYEYTERVEGFVDEGETSIHARRAEVRAIKDGIVGKIHVKKGDVIDNERYAHSFNSGWVLRRHLQRETWKSRRSIFNSATLLFSHCSCESNSTILMEYEGCDHDTQYEGICVVCCKTVPKNLKSHVNMTHDATSLSVSRTVSVTASFGFP